MDERSSPTSGSKADHLCVLVHGLWGNATHLNYVAESLRDFHGDDILVYSAKRNTGSLTYDGIEVGAERLAKELEELLQDLHRTGQVITKFSIVGYSLGGVVARYTIGLLDQKGYFDEGKLKPINFNTFATPHLGVRTPLVGYPNKLWNVFGARTLSTSGQQLFLVDSFRDTNRPLLGVLADPESIFIHALSKFERRALYANIVNDRSAPYYTTAIARIDPYTDLDKLELNYVKGYDDVILNPDQPLDLAVQELPTFYQRISNNSQTILRRTPIFMALSVILPVAVVAFIINAGYQTLRSKQRIQLHETDGLGFGKYRIPYMIQNMRLGLEDAFESVNAAQQQEHLPNGSEEMASPPASPVISRVNTAELVPKENSIIRQPEFPTLALTTEQFGMVQTLDDVGFRKYPVHIHKVRHSHAAIIVRTPWRKGFSEGKIVIRHWLENEFKI